MLAAPQQQQTVRKQAAGSTQPAPPASNGGQGSVSPGPPSTGQLSSGGQQSLHRLSSTGAPSEGALSPLQGGAGRGAQGLQPLLEQLAHSQASPTNLAADTTGQQTGTQPRGGEGGVPGNDWERRSRRSRRSSDVGEADEPSLHSVPFDPVASPSRGPPQTQAPQQQIGLINCGVTPIGVAVQDSSLKTSQGPAGAQATSPTSGGPSPGGAVPALAPGDRSFKTITSVRARAPIMSILQQGPLGKKDAKAAPQPAPQPSRQLAYSKSLSLKGQQEFLRQQKAEQEALEKIKEEQEKKQKDAQEKQEQEQLERELQMYMDPRSTLGYSSSVAVRPANSTDTGRGDTAAAAAAAVAAVDAAAAAPPAECALAASTSIQPATRVVNPTLSSSVARPPAAPVAPAPVVLAGPYTGVVPTASRIAGIAVQQVLKSAVKTPEDPEKETAARAAQDTTQLLKYEQQLLAAKLAEIQLKQQQQRQEGGTDGALIDDDDAETDREEEEAPSPPSESLLRWIEENNMRMNQKLRGRMVGP